MKLSDLQVGYQHAIWEGLAAAAVASKVTFFDGTGTTVGTGTIPPVAVPDPNDKIGSQQGPTRTCTLPPGAVSPRPADIDRQHRDAPGADRVCRDAGCDHQVTVEGRTASVSGADSLLRETGVPADNIASVVGYGDAKPLIEPASESAVVVTFTSAG